MSNEREQDFVFTDTDFRRVVSIIYARAGIRLNESKQPMVYSRLARRLRALNLAKFSDYLNFLEADPKHEEWQQFTNSLTTNLTFFFREKHHFEMLSDQLHKLHGPVRIWCSASSTGEEPYSLAMTAVEVYGRFNSDVQIIASDLDTQVLAKAQNGIYSMDKLDKVSPEKCKIFFLKGVGKNAGQAKVRKELRAMIEFKQINLLANSWPLTPYFDTIFCRNVMIYFDQATQKVMLEKMGRLLKPNGFLYVGHSENLHHMSEWFYSCGKTVYRLTDKAIHEWGLSK
ncbi:CheR family methyltransferase [Iodobacter ciconiae]|uniref:Chemotaxis protein methyltransferase n=1 Tax=Iodobacter ciconiae TaxID=2496266 RepID=A0A3S8ZQ55_9NEIS|nr:CheR family methyltransferase [Iodobacter ciconiae]AZN35606.1 chemotaxis protein CheR [Iodobacter ciconiae]